MGVGTNDDFGGVPEPEFFPPEVKLQDQAWRQRFDQKAAQVLNLKAPSIYQLGDTFLYRISPRESLALARVLLALFDERLHERIPGVKKAVERHLDRLVKGADGFPRRAGPAQSPGRPVKFSPEEQQHIGKALYPLLRSLCESPNPPPTSDDVARLVGEHREHLPNWSGELADRQELERILALKTMPANQKARRIVKCVFGYALPGISMEKSTRAGPVDSFH